MRRPSDTLRLLLLGLMAVVGIGFIGWVMHTGMLTDGVLAAHLAELGHWLRPAAIGILTLGVILWIPLTLLVILAISIFPPAEALLLATVALIAGSTISWLLARTVGHDPIERLLSRRAAIASHIRGGFARRAFASLVLMRAAGVSSNLASYLAGVTGVRWRVHATACLAGEFTGMATTAFLGAGILDVIRQLDVEAAFSVETGIGLVSGVCTLAIIAWAQHKVRQQSEAIVEGEASGGSQGQGDEPASGDYSPPEEDTHPLARHEAPESAA